MVSDSVIHYIYICCIFITVIIDCNFATSTISKIFSTSSTIKLADISSSDRLSQSKERRNQSSDANGIFKVSLLVKSSLPMAPMHHSSVPSLSLPTTMKYKSSYDTFTSSRSSKLSTKVSLSKGLIASSSFGSPMLKTNSLLSASTSNDETMHMLQTHYNTSTKGTVDATSYDTVTASKRFRLSLKSSLSNRLMTSNSFGNPMLKTSKLLSSSASYSNDKTMQTLHTHYNTSIKGTIDATSYDTSASSGRFSVKSSSSNKLMASSSFVNSILSKNNLLSSSASYSNDGTMKTLQTHYDTPIKGTIAATSYDALTASRSSILSLESSSLIKQMASSSFVNPLLKTSNVLSSSASYSIDQKMQTLQIHHDTSMKGTIDATSFAILMTSNATISNFLSQTLATNASTSIINSSVQTVLRNLLIKLDGSFGNATVNCSFYNASLYENQTIYNITYRRRCLLRDEIEDDKGIPWYEEPKTFMIAGACVIGLVLLIILKLISSYCSKYSGEFYPPRWQLPRRKRGQEAWTLRQLDYIPPISDVEPPGKY